MYDVLMKYSQFKIYKLGGIMEGFYLIGRTDPL